MAESKIPDPTDWLEQQLKESNEETYNKLVESRKQCKNGEAKLDPKYDYKECRKTHLRDIKTIQSEKNDPFENYGMTVSVTPQYTFYPKTTSDVQTIVKNALRRHKRVRVVGAGHSWSPLFCDPDEWLISTEKLNGNMEVKTLENGQKTVSMQPGVTTGQLMEFLKQNRVMIPMDVVLDTVTYGGTICTGSHGAGWDLETLSDIVYAVEMVVSDGSVRSFGPDDGEEVMSAVSLSLGLFGVVTSLTLKVDDLRNAKVENKKYDIEEVFPRNGDDFTVLRKICEENFFNEIFWFPFTDKLHVMTFNLTDEPTTHDEVPSFGDMWTQVAISGGNFLLDILFDKGGSDVLQGLGIEGIVNEWFGKIMTTGMRTDSYIVPQPNALHWREYIPLMKVSDTEMAIPVQNKETEEKEPDFSMTRDCFYKCLDMIYQYREKQEYPVNIAVEMRFIAGSQALLSPARGNDHTCYLEFLSGSETPGFFDFSDIVAREWMKISPRTVPHWAKWQQGIDGIVDTLKDHYRDEIVKFKKIRAELGVDPCNMFSNTYLDDVFDFKVNFDGEIEDDGDGILPEFNLDPAENPNKDKCCSIL